MTTASISPHPETSRASDDRSRLVQLAYGFAASVLLVGAYASNFAELIKTWWNEPDYSHGFLVPILALAIAWRGVVKHDAFKPSYLGLVLLVIVLTARAACFEAGEFWIETATILPAVAALVLAFGGWPLLRRTWPAIAFLVFMLTIPATVDAQLSQPLQRIAAKSSGALLRLSGLWVVNEGNVLDVGGERLEVATACNGLAMLMSLSATVAAIMLMVPMAWWKRVGVLLGAVPIALLCNVLRIAATSYCYEAFGSATGRDFAHTAAGWLMMPLALGLIGLELAWFSWLVPEGKAASSALRPCLPGITTNH